MNNVTSTVLKGTRFIKKNASTILTVGSVAGVGITAITSGHAAVKFEKEMDKLPGDANFTDKAKVYAKCFAIPAVAIAGTSACIVASQVTNLKKQASLLSAYVASEKAIDEFKKQSKKILGKEKASEVEDAVTTKMMGKAPSMEELSMIDQLHDELFFDAVSGRYFMFNTNALGRIQNGLNDELVQYKPVSLNDVYYKLGLDAISIGEELGWGVDKRIEFSLNSKISENGRPCIVLDYMTRPTSLYERYY